MKRHSDAEWIAKEIGELAQVVEGVALAVKKYSETPLDVPPLVRAEMSDIRNALLEVAVDIHQFRRRHSQKD